MQLKGEDPIAAAHKAEGPTQGHWTYADYAALPDDGRRYEIINGILFLIPSPNKWHQKVVGRLYTYLLKQVEDAVKGNGYSSFGILQKQDSIRSKVLLELDKTEVEQFFK